MEVKSANSVAASTHADLLGRLGRFIGCHITRAPRWYQLLLPAPPSGSLLADN